MESAEPTRVAKLSKWKRNRLDIVNKFQSIKEDSTASAFGFSHGNLILGSPWASIVANFFFYVLMLFSGVMVLALFKKQTHYPSVALLNLHIPVFMVQSVFYFAGVMTIDLAEALFGFGLRKRSFLLAGYFVAIFLLPMILFHWSFMGWS